MYQLDIMSQNVRDIIIFAKYYLKKISNMLSEY